MAAALLHVEQLVFQLDANPEAERTQGVANKNFTPNVELLGVVPLCSPCCAVFGPIVKRFISRSASTRSLTDAS